LPSSTDKQLGDAVLTLAGLLFAAAATAPQSATAQQRPGQTVFVDLAYPSDALDARGEGAVIVQVTVDDAGKVTESKALAGPEALARAAVENVRQWTFPAKWQFGTMVYRFEILRGACNDDHHSLFEFRSPNLVVVSTCTAVGRQGLQRWYTLRISSWGKPSYPAIAQSASIAGVVALEIWVDRKGRVTRSRALTNIPLLADAALELSRSWIVETSEPAHGIIALEFAFDDDGPCDEPHERARQIAPDYLRLTTCRPELQVAAKPRK
jgi:TonB family protein